MIAQPIFLEELGFLLLSTGQVGPGVRSWPSNRTTRDRLPSEIDYTS